MDMLNEAQQLLSEIGNGKMRATTYDTAWAARLQPFDETLAHSALEWLCEHQNEDGSWGVNEAYYCDRIICTLSALIALTQYGRRRADRFRIEYGLSALDRIILSQNMAEDQTIGFEMIIPSLVRQAVELNLISQQAEQILRPLEALRQRKLRLLQNYGKLIDRHVTVAFSAEMAGSDMLSLLDKLNLQEANGSIAVSPSATAYYASYVLPGDTAALNYLRANQQPDGGLPNVAPFDVFERAWTLWNLSLTSEMLQETIPGGQQHLDFLAKEWKPRAGVTYASGLSPKDADDTGVVFEVLSRFGYEVDVTAVLRYEEDTHFRCFDLEANPSISANIHVAAGLREVGYERHHPALAKVINFLSGQRTVGGYWLDKWHLSPYYPTGHAIIAFGGFANDIAQPALDWLIDSQRPNGGWGVSQSTPEETAYALQALLFWKKQGNTTVPLEVLRKGREWLRVHQNDCSPSLWIGKCLYCPERVVQSAVFSALLMAEAEI
jgi:halimadienyl-diphosphate synthase